MKNGSETVRVNVPVLQRCYYQGHLYCIAPLCYTDRFVSEYLPLISRLLRGAVMISLGIRPDDQFSLTFRKANNGKHIRMAILRYQNSREYAFPK